MEQVMTNFQINVQNNAAVNYHLSSLSNLRIDQCGIYNHSTINNHANIYITFLIIIKYNHLLLVVINSFLKKLIPVFMKYLS